MANVYSFLNVVAALSGPGGSVNLGAGAAVADEGITITSSTEINAMVVGADGNGQHSLHADKSGRITVRLLKTSPVNRILSSMYNAQTSDAAQHGQNTFSLVDKQRGDSVTGAGVAFMKAPDLTYGREAGFVEWEFQAITIDRILGS